MSQLALPYYPSQSKKYKAISDKIWYLNNKELAKTNSKKHYETNKEHRLSVSKKYYYKNIERLSIYSKNNYKKNKLSVLKMINPHLKCIRCGCDDTRFLEINHKNGGGGKELKNSKYRSIYKLIIYGKRKTDDLELLCKPCNNIHALEMKYKQEIPIKSVFINNDWEKEL